MGRGNSHRICAPISRATIQTKSLEIEFEPLYFVLLFWAGNVPYVSFRGVHQWLTIILPLRAQFQICLTKLMKLDVQFMNALALHSRKVHAHLKYQRSSKRRHNSRSKRRSGEWNRTWRLKQRSIEWSRI